MTINVNSTKVIKLTVIFVFVALTLVVITKIITNIIFKPTPSGVRQGVTANIDEKGKINTRQENKNPEIIAEDLNIPWDIAFLPDESLLLSERPGNLLRISRDGGKTLIQKIEGVKHTGEGGLLGITLHPDFKNNNYIYLYMTSEVNKKVENRVERYKYDGGKLDDRKVILSGIAGSSNHDGGRIEFGPDGYLYITTGDAQNDKTAADKNSLSGKVLRVTDDGNPVEGNPFGNYAYSYGHRNPQGLAWDAEGNLWETEHGPSGTKSGNDEVNLIKSGNNYGWPDYVGSQSGEGITTPVVESGRSDTWAPASLAYFRGSLFFGGLRGEALYQAKIKEGNKLELVAHFKNEFGRIRTVRVGPDGFLYITTSNRDGRGTVKEGDDRILKINPEIFGN